jgi:hypothetical protein
VSPSLSHAGTWEGLVNGAECSTLAPIPLARKAPLAKARGFSCIFLLLLFFFGSIGV